MKALVHVSDDEGDDGGPLVPDEAVQSEDSLALLDAVLSPGHDADDRASLAHVDEGAGGTARGLLGYAVGDPLRPADVGLLCHNRVSTASAMSRLRVGDGAFVSRSNGTFTYATYEGRLEERGEPMHAFSLDPSGRFKKCLSHRAFMKWVKIPALPADGVAEDHSDDEKKDGDAYGSSNVSVRAPDADDMARSRRRPVGRRNTADDAVRSRVPSRRLSLQLNHSAPDLNDAMPPTDVSVVEESAFQREALARILRSASAVQLSCHDEDTDSNGLNFLPAVPEKPSRRSSFLSTRTAVAGAASARELRPSAPLRPRHGVEEGAGRRSSDPPPFCLASYTPRRQRRATAASSYLFPSRAPFPRSRSETFRAPSNERNASTNDSAAKDAEGEATEQSQSKATPEMYTKGTRVYYKKQNEDAVSARILDAHLDDELVPYYTIQLEDGREKQTDHARIFISLEP